ncbi:protein translocase subunit yajC [Panacagrimonas perspica]|uniref:Sec translocon accessory complex subunit YajC n=1 Tax=Panacagrimonas perspica TaxID=381431 RepID=A0A4R7NT85_9GAMM|nr:preprotein translocase subunit YajC [Panacagrimonas perspica]TDU24295.1 protein translocase subunit yajC [Panacagrimonas perspica]THD04696.1 preprotein translocase subunit YajC [Panacagrimonas perspica]
MSLLDLVISPAFAQAAPAAPNPIFQFAPLVVLGVIFYFMLIRPQMKRTKEHRQMLGALAKGDEAVTSGGIAGKVTNIGENYVSLEVAEGVSIKIQKAAVTQVLPKGTLKAL